MTGGFLLLASALVERMVSLTRRAFTDKNTPPVYRPRAESSSRMLKTGTAAPDRTRLRYRMHQQACIIATFSFVEWRRDTG